MHLGMQFGRRARQWHEGVVLDITLEEGKTVYKVQALYEELTWFVCSKYISKKKDDGNTLSNCPICSKSISILPFKEREIHMLHCAEITDIIYEAVHLNTRADSRNATHYLNLLAEIGARGYGTIL